MGSDNDKPKRWQFSIRAMMVAITGVAVVIGMVFVFPNWLAEPLAYCFAIASPSVLAVAAIYGRDNVRVFAIGAMSPQVALLMIYSTSGLYTVITTSGIHTINMMDVGYTIGEVHLIRGMWLLSCLVSVVVGCICVGIRHLVGRSSE